ncbi:MAG: hypothetical protein PHS30_04335 [Bacteroidales bacterium]|nr:hypothetical protein [Bacteroidales bacterium]
MGQKYIIFGEWSTFAPYKRCLNMFGRVLIPYFCISLAGLHLSCASKSDVQADDYLAKAKELILTQQFQAAKLYVDSVGIKFPKEYEKIREGLGVIREINFAEQKRTLAFCDSMLKVRQNELPAAQEGFVFEKNTEYESIGHYVYKTQNNSIGRTFLQTKVDEKGNLILTSYYSGPWALNHTSVRVSSNDGSYAESQTVPKDGALNYSFMDGGTHYEIVRFNKKAENGVVNYILSHRQTVTITLLGGRKKAYSLSANDKRAMLEASELSVILTDITRLLSEIRLSQAKLDYIYKKQEAQKSGTDSTN